MNSEFKEYLQDFLKMYGIAIDTIDFDCVSDLQSMLKQLEGSIDHSPAIQHHLKMIFDLNEKGVHIYEDGYKTSECYSKIKDNWEETDTEEIISIENYIERFLLDRQRLLDVYESIYAMGNPYEIDDEQCKLAEILITKFGILEGEYDTDDITDKIEKGDPDFLKNLLRFSSLHFTEMGKLDMRLGGLLKRLRHFHFCLEEFPFTTEYKAEICKIIYFFHQLDHTPIIPNLQGKKSAKASGSAQRYFNSTDFLSEPSMENTGYILSGRKRSNGIITDFIKNQLEKELYPKDSSLKEMNDIKAGFRCVANTWNKLIENARNAIDMDRKFDFDPARRIPKSFIPFFPTYEDSKQFNYRNEDPDPSVPTSDHSYPASPIARIYFIILQFEYLGEVADRREINSIEICSKYDVPQEYVERMKLYQDQLIDDDVEAYILKNVERIAEDVYSKLKPTKKERDKICSCANRVSTILECCAFAGRLIKPKELPSELLVISCLQAIILDKKSDREYVFYDYQYHLETAHKPRLSAPKNNPKNDIQRLYLARQVEEHWYANLGKYEKRQQLRMFEVRCYEVLFRLYQYSDLEEMLHDSQNYYEQLNCLIEK